MLIPDKHAVVYMNEYELQLVIDALQVYPGLVPTPKNPMDTITQQKSVENIVEMVAAFRVARRKLQCLP